MPENSYATSSSDNSFKPYVGSMLLYDSNFLRLPNNIGSDNFSDKNHKSEFLKQIAAGFNMDWRISRQHFTIKANVNENWFQNFNSLNYLGWNTEANWNWKAGSKLNGEVSYVNIQELANFNFLNRLVNNLRNQQNFFASAGYLFHPNGRIKLDLFRTESKFDDNSRRFNTNIENNAKINLQYLSPTGSFLGLQAIATDGKFPNRILTAGSTFDNTYTRMSYAVTWNWLISSKTDIGGLIGYTHQNYQHFSVRDFSDVIGVFNLNWQATDKTRLMLSTRREIEQFVDLASDFLLNQGVWLDLSWQFSPKIYLTLPIGYQHQQFLGKSGIGSADSNQRKDHVGNVGLNLSYHLLDNISTSVIFNYEKRRSNEPFRDYQTLSATVNLQVNFH